MSNTTYEIDDNKSFEANFLAFFEALVSIDPPLAETLKLELPRLFRGELNTGDLWDALHAAASASTSP